MTYPKDHTGYAPSEEMVAKFKAEVHDRADEIDPSGEWDWYAITLGWAIAQGMSVDPDAADGVETAHDFARYIRYRTDLA